MAVILCYFTELLYDVVIKELPRFQNLLLILYDHIMTMAVFCVISVTSVAFSAHCVEVVEDIPKLSATEI